MLDTCIHIFPAEMSIYYIISFWQWAMGHSSPVHLLWSIHSISLHVSTYIMYIYYVETTALQACFRSFVTGVTGNSY